MKSTDQFMAEVDADLSAPRLLDRGRHVIIVNGPPRAGKDTLIRFMKSILPCASAEFSSIDPVREMLGRAVDLSQKTEADRKLLATVGDALEEHSFFRTHACMEAAGLFFAARYYGVFFCHIREPRHIIRLKRAWKLQGIAVTTVLLQSTRAEMITSNPADAGVFGMKYDVELRNDGAPDDLEATARSFLVDLGIISRLT